MPFVPDTFFRSFFRSTVDNAAHDNDEAADDDANADQDAADAWEKTQAPAANADLKAVDAANNKAAHAQDAAAKTANDQIAKAKTDQQNKDANAAQTHDTKVAAVQHDRVTKEAQKVHDTVQTAAAAAAKGVTDEVTPIPADVVAAVNAAVIDARAKNFDQTDKSIGLANTERTVLMNRVQVQIINATATAQRQRKTDYERKVDDPVITSVDPPQPRTVWQDFLSYLPSWQTVAMVGLGAAALLIPGAGPVLFVIGIGMLAGAVLGNAAERYFNQDQSGLQSLVGGTSDATGVTALYAGVTGYDLATQRHLGLTDAQRHQSLTTGALQTGLLAWGGVRGTRNFLAGRQAAAPKPPIEPPVMPGNPKPPPVTPELATPPAKPPAGGGGTVRVYRVEGAPNARVLIGEGGQVTIVDAGKTLFLNFGSKARAEQYFAQKLAKGLPGTEVKSFEVPKSFVDELRAAAVTEKQLNLDPSLAGRPLRVDTTKAADQFGLRSEQIEALEQAIIQGSGKVGLE